MTVARGSRSPLPIEDEERSSLTRGSLVMKRAFKPFTLLMILGVVLLSPVLLSCTSASVASPDPTPLGAESGEDQEESEEQGG